FRKMLTQKVSGKRQRGNPNHRTTYIIQDKTLEIEADDACKYGSKCTNNRNKSPDNQGCTSILVEKLFGHDHVLAFKHPGILSLKKHGTRSPPKPITGKIAQYSCCKQAQTKGDDIHINFFKGTE